MSYAASRALLLMFLMITISVAAGVDSEIDGALRASDEPLDGALCLNGIAWPDTCTEGIQANTHAAANLPCTDQPASLHIPDAYASQRVEFALNMSLVQRLTWENDHEAAFCCLAKGLERFNGIEHEALLINPGTRETA